MNILSEIGIQQWRLRQPRVTESLNEGEDDAVIDSGLGASANELKDWQGLETWLQEEHCQSCKQGGYLLGEGDRMADYLFLVDAPSCEALNQQMITNGRARRLYEAMLNAISLDINKVYTASVFKCAPSEQVSVSTACQDLLSLEVMLVEPKVIVCLGEFSAQTLLKSNEPLASLREQTHKFPSTDIDVVPSESLIELLQTPKLKAHAWQDLKRARAAALNTERTQP